MQPSVISLGSAISTLVAWQPGPSVNQKGYLLFHFPAQFPSNHHFPYHICLGAGTLTSSTVKQVVKPRVNAINNVL